jgi:hypothetical protein
MLNTACLSFFSFTTRVLHAQIRNPTLSLCFHKSGHEARIYRAQYVLLFSIVSHLLNQFNNSLFLGFYCLMIIKYQLHQNHVQGRSNIRKMRYCARWKMLRVIPLYLHLSDVHKFSQKFVDFLKKSEMKDQKNRNLLHQDWNIFDLFTALIYRCKCSHGRLTCSCYEARVVEFMKLFARKSQMDWMLERQG